MCGATRTAERLPNSAKIYMGYTCNTGVVTLKKILVSIPEGVHNLIREMKGKLGESDSEIIRNIVIAYLSEQGYFSKFGVITGVASSENIT